MIWGLGIGDWAQPPIPNPQSPIPNSLLYKTPNIKILEFKNRKYQENKISLI